MSRAINTTMAAALANAIVSPVFLAVLTFKSGTRYVWTGIGNLVYGGNTYLGIGSLGSIGGIQEGIDVRADGTSVTLSGIDPVLLGECMTDIQQSAPAILYFGLMSNGAFIGTPYKLFAGIVDVPSVSVGGETISISLSLESPMIDGQRPNMRRYTSADQRIHYPDDTGFTWVEQLNDLALNWGG